MKQKITVRALVRDNGKVLLLKRANGRESLINKLELPGGEIQPGEQPEDAIRRLLQESTGLLVDTVQLYDVLNFKDIQADVNDLIVLFLINTQSVNVTLNSSKYSKFKWQRVADVQYTNATDTTLMLLKMQNNEESLPLQKASLSDVIVYSDGGSRGNPGPSAAGYVVFDAKENLLMEGGSYLGVTTNNQAEYQAVYLGLLKASEYTQGIVEFRIDSLLVVNQMKGLYQIKNRDLWPIHEKINELKKHFKKVNFIHVKREFNQHADGIVNRILDEQGWT